MTVAELIEELRNYPSDMTVGLSATLPSGINVLDEPKVKMVKVLDFPGVTHMLVMFSDEDSDLPECREITKLQDCI